MQFFKSTILLAVAFVTFAVAVPAEPTEDWNTPKPKECKPLAQSCKVNSECCADLCVAGVSILKLCVVLDAHRCNFNLVVPLSLPPILIVDARGLHSGMSGSTCLVILF
jgi:hypothetical protein